MKKKRCFLSILPVYVLVLGLLIGISIWGSDAITVISENSSIGGRKCVIIDAGHGGEDGGATSYTGVLESKINLEIAIRLEDLFHLIGVDTVMIRDTDRSVYTDGNTLAAKKVSDLKQRVKIVNETENSILVSIHQNHFSDSRYSGAQIFYANANDSDQLARELQALIVQTLDPDNNRQSKPADGVYLMQHIKKTGILIECGFISNPEEEAKLRSEEYQKRLCCVFASAISNYLDREVLD